MGPLFLIRPRRGDAPRLDAVLNQALAGLDVREIGREEDLENLQGRRLLFALDLGEYGVNLAWSAMLERLRREPGLLEGCAAGMVVDARGELYTKSAARELAFAANRCGCAFVGKPLVEGTGSLTNFTVLAKLGGTDLMGAYRAAARELALRVLDFKPPRYERARLAVLHASSHSTSNTMALWKQIRKRVEPWCDITEVGLRNGVMVDCSGCPYQMCLHFGERGGCFYGGVMVEEVYPALRGANAVVLLCPNYNDAVSANLTACVNRLTALFRTTRFYDKAMFGIVVSGYSGGDIVAQQLIGALCMNKTFYLPPRAVMTETANDAGAAMRLPGIQGRLDAFAGNLLKRLIQPPQEAPGEE